MKLATNFEMGYSLCQFEDTISEFYLDLKFKVTHDQLTKHNFRVTVTSTKPIKITYIQIYLYANGFALKLGANELTDESSIRTLLPVDFFPSSFNFCLCLLLLFLLNK